MVKTYEQKETELMELAKNDYFFKEKAIANWTPFFIFSYDPKEELRARELSQRFWEEVESKWHKSTHINLYELIMEILTDWADVEDYANVEKDYWFKHLLENVIPWILNPEIVEAKFFEKVWDNDLVYVTHIWVAWPYLRAHNLLNNLTSHNYSWSILFFYPWEYKKNDKWQRYLSLFNEFSEGNYYRAISICE